MEHLNSENSDEISLYDLWNIAIKRKLIIIVIFLITVTSVTVVSFAQPKIYRGEAVLRILPLEIATSNITAKEMADIIGKIDEENKDRLLPKTHKSMTSITINSLKESKDKIEVILEAKDVNAIQPAFSEIIEYVNSLNLVKLNMKEELEKLSKRSAELSTVIEASSDLLSTYQRLLKAGKLVPVGFNPIELNKRIYDIKMEKLLTEQAIRRIRGGVEIVKEVDIKDRPIKPKIKTDIILSCILGLIGGILTAFFVEFWERIKRGRGADD